jgi:hypothetical protein
VAYIISHGFPLDLPILVAFFAAEQSFSKPFFPSAVGRFVVAPSMIMLLELGGIIPAVENHPSPSRMTEGQCPDIVLRLEERHTAAILDILCIGPAKIGAVAGYLSKGSGNLVQQGNKLRRISAITGGQHRRIDDLVWLTGLDGQMQFLEIPSTDLLSHSHIEIRTPMMFLKPGAVYTRS